MKRPVQPLLIALGIFAVLAVLAAVVWIRFDAARQGELASGAHPAAMSPGDTALTPPANLADASALEGSSDAAANARTAAAKNAAGTSVSKIAVDGVVRPPAQGGSDDRVEVFGLARESDLDTLFNAIGPKRNADDGPADVEATGLVVSRVRADASGKFRLTFPEGTRKAHLIVAGRSWFMRDTIAVDLTKGDANVALQPEAGAWITASITLPSGVTANASLLDGEVATLKPELGGFGGGFGGPQRGGRGGMAAFQRSDRRVSVQGGIAEFFAVDPSSGYTIEITPRDFASVQANAPELVGGRGADVSVALTRGGVVRGRVLGAAGEGLEGATVEARLTGVLFGFDDRTVRRTKSAHDGSFELAAVAAGNVQVSARLKGHVEADVQKVDVQEGSAHTGVDFTLGEGTTIAGIVTWKDGQPASDADVTIAPERGGGFGGGGGGGRNGGRGNGNANGNGGFGGAQRGFFGGRNTDAKVVTDSAGRFVVKGLGAGPFTVTAEALTPADRAIAANAKPDVKRRLAHQGRVESIAAGALDVALVVTPPIGVAGHVTDASTSAPVAQFTIKAQVSASGQGGGRQGPFGGGGGGGNRLSQDVDDATGKFLLTGLREGTWKVSIVADGYSNSDAIEVTIPRKEGEAELAFALIRAASIEGVVKSPDGAPVAGATVAVPSSTAGAPWMRGGGAAEETPTARTDADGHFVLEGFKPGRAAISAESKLWARSAELAFDLVAGQKVEGVVLTMRRGATITGEVYDDSGRRASARTVQGTEMKTFTAATARTDTGGHFKIEHVEPGSWRLMAMPTAQDIAGATSGAADAGPGGFFGRMKFANADVAEGEEVHVVIGAPPEDPVVVLGKVTHSGEPVAGARIMFSGQGQGFGPGMKNATSAADGTFSITVDKPGEYSASVNPSGGMMNMIEFPVTVPSTKEYALELALPTGRISGLVRDPDGQPAVGVRVSLQPQAAATAGTMFGGQVNENTTDSEGRYDMQSLRPGTYTVLVGGANIGGGRFQSQSDATVGREAKSDLQIKEGEWKKDVDFRLHKAGSVQVEVVDEGGAAVQGASVFARNENGQLLDRVSMVRTDAKGIASYGGLAPGRISFSARKDGLASGESTRVTMTEAGSGSVRITLTPGTNLTVTTVESDDTPLRSSVSVFDEGGRDVSSMMGIGDMMQRMQRGGASGNEQKFGPLAPGKYRVRATAQDGRTMEKSVTLAGTPEKKLTLAFSK